jgi:FtsH-binding integral membrane protein
MSSQMTHGSEERNHDDGKSGMQRTMYLRFAAMILTSMVLMYWVMFVGSWEWSHVRFSQSRVFMALTMGGTMGLVMLAWMLNMYRDAKGNFAVVVASLLLLVGGVVLDRTQATVGDVSFMRAMIPHHSLAITRSERFDVDDLRVCELAREISEAQRREILEMDWLIDDIEENGAVTSSDEAAQRSVPQFDVSAGIECGAD